MPVNPVPQGFHSLTPYLTVRGVDKVIDFLARAFGAEIAHEPIMRPDGKIMHAQVKIGDSIVMLGEESERAKATASTLYVYVPDVDRTYQQAVTAGGQPIMEPTDMFYGDRCGGVKDSSGNSWMVATHIEDVSVAELQKRATDFMNQQENQAA